MLTPRQTKPDTQRNLLHTNNTSLLMTPQNRVQIGMPSDAPDLLTASHVCLSTVEAHRMHLERRGVVNKNNHVCTKRIKIAPHFHSTPKQVLNAKTSSESDYFLPKMRFSSESLSPGNTHTDGSSRSLDILDYLEEDDIDEDEGVITSAEMMSTKDISLALSLDLGYDISMPKLHSIDRNNFERGSARAFKVSMRRSSSPSFSYQF